MSQAQREVTLKKFRDGRFSVLVATDVAARGIDIDGVDLIVQYRMPNDAEAYVHRSGRTGRAGRSGTALLLYTERERRDVSNLERRAGVQFTKAGPPSVSTVMEAAVALVPRRLAALLELHELLKLLDPLRRAVLVLGLPVRQLEGRVHLEPEPGGRLFTTRDSGLQRVDLLFQPLVG